MKEKEQFALDLGHRSAYGREDFYVSLSNQEAVAWLDKWPAWPAPTLVIHGPTGSGKTHLSHVWKKETGAHDVSPENLHGFLSAAPSEKFCVAIDDAHRLIGDKETESNVFHLYNIAREKGGYLLLTADTSPATWPFSLPDMKSRMLAAPSAALLPPDDDLMAVLLTKAFSDRQIFVSQDVVKFVLARVERSFLALHALADAIDRKALAEKRPVTIPLVQELLKE